MVFVVRTYCFLFFAKLFDEIDPNEASHFNFSEFRGIFKLPEGGGKCTICLREFTFYANARCPFYELRFGPKG
jgi:hypothetical protein